MALEVPKFLRQKEIPKTNFNSVENKRIIQFQVEIAVRALKIERRFAYSGEIYPEDAEWWVNVFNLENENGVNNVTTFRRVMEEKRKRKSI